MDTKVLWFGGVASVLLLACGGEEPAGGTGSGSPGSGGSGAGSNAGASSTEGGAGGAGASIGSGGTPDGGYPAGPYGVEVGDTIENLLWEGYVNDDAQGLANTEPFVDYSMDAVRQSGKSLAFVHFGAVF
jgi:hypothetical protein